MDGRGTEKIHATNSEAQRRTRFTAQVRFVQVHVNPDQPLESIRHEAFSWQRQLLHSFYIKMKAICWSANGPYS